jgi:hypothetical protein
MKILRIVFASNTAVMHVVWLSVQFNIFTDDGAIYQSQAPVAVYEI